MTSHRGFACVGLYRPKCDGNVGGAIRAASVYEARHVVIAGDRSDWPTKGRLERTDTRSSHRHMPVSFVSDLADACPHESVMVAIEIANGAVPLPVFEHPPSAFYVFGPEDGSLPSDVLRRCHHVVSVPTSGCMNLAATVNVTLYDRMAKQFTSEGME